jgi:hypothetical protein
MSELPLLPRTPDPVHKPGMPKTLTRWDFFLGDLAAGTPVDEARQKHLLTRADIETIIRADPLQMQRWDDARAAAERSSWSIFQIEEIFARVAQGVTVKKAVIDVIGNAGGDFYALIARDPDLMRRYKQAQEIAMLRLHEEIIELADDDSQDTLDTGGKSGTVPNNAAVARSKLQVDARFRKAGQLNGKLFGEAKQQVNVQVNLNHAERLEECRERARTRAPSAKRQAIDVPFSEKTDTQETPT